MAPLERLRAAVGGVRRIAGGRAAGLTIALPAHADRDFARGTYEAPIQDVLVDRLRPGDVFFDVGANVGFFTLLAARAILPSGRVYAFEPVPRSAAMIRWSIRRNRLTNAEVLAVAAGARTGASTLRLARHIGGAALACAEPPPDFRQEIEVETVTLDDAIERRGLPPPQLVKIDVEGAELEVLQGAERTLRLHRPALLYEVDGATSAWVERRARAIATLLYGLHYTLSPLPAAYPGVGWHVEHVLATPSRAGA